MHPKILYQIRKLVGPITACQLKNVEYAINEDIGIFIPTVGQCGYAITSKHIHPAYSILIAFEPNSPIFPKEVTPKRDEYGCTAMSPQIPHEEEPLEGFTRFVAVLINVSTFERVWGNYTTKYCGPFFWTTFVVPQSIMIHIKQFFAEFGTNQPGTCELLKALGTCITHFLIRAMLKMNVSVEGISARLEIQRAIEIMHSHYDKKISVPLLARKVNCSESHFSRLFKQEIGYSPVEYLIKIRIEKARKLLFHTEKNATEVAFECGFASTAHFSDTFRKCVGISPLQYRKKFT